MDEEKILDYAEHVVFQVPTSYSRCTSCTPYNTCTMCHMDIVQDVNHTHNGTKTTCECKDAAVIFLKKKFPEASDDVIIKAVDKAYEIHTTN